MDNNKVIIYTLIILLIVSVVFNPSITGNAFWTRIAPTATVPITDTGIDVVGTGATCTTSVSKGKVVLTTNMPDNLCKTTCGGYYSTTSEMVKIIASATPCCDAQRCIRCWPDSCPACFAKP